MDTTQLARVARRLTSEGRGLLAADESEGTIGKRMLAVGIDPTPATRLAFRELMFGTPGLEQAISGVILHEETLPQAGADGERFVDVLKAKGIIPGIKVDRGTVALPGSPEEKLTQGLDGLRERLAAYLPYGVEFAKWRAVLNIGEPLSGQTLPSASCIRANAEVLALYAAYCQEAGLVPIVEPELVMSGSHDSTRCAEASTRILHALFASLKLHAIDLGGLLLKVHMVLPGSDSGLSAPPTSVAEQTLALLDRTLPEALAGVVFLSGGQAARQATENLDAIHRQGSPRWPLSFSFARALSDPVLDCWRGDPARRETAQRVLLHRARCNREARFGRYGPALEAEFAGPGGG